MLLDFLRRGDRTDPVPPVADPAETAAPSANRRGRQVDAGAETVAEALGTKLLHGWLQNRHQTLMPLSLNLSRLGPAQQDAVARFLATLLLAGRPDAAAAAPALRGWLAELGGGPAIGERFDAALAAPMPLNELFETAQALELTTYAYVVALAASDTRYPVSTMLCDMVQARFDLPTAVVRSAVRRYRR